MLFISLITTTLLQTTALATAAEPPATTTAPYKTEKIISGRDSIWGQTFLNKDEVLATERKGQFIRIDIKNKTVTEIKGAPKVYHSGQGGLLDITVGPNFAKDKWVYFTYSTEKDGKTSTILARGKYQNTEISNIETLFTAQPFLKSKQHFGSRIVFDGKGHVFVSIGERNERDYAQELKSTIGKIIRLKEDGTVPTDNPFVGDKDKAPEIWSYGHRNPQGLFYDQATNKLYAMEHGPRGGDEINVIEKGANYGWPIITYGKEYWGPSIGEGTSKAGIEQPLKYYVPSIAPCDLILYTGGAFPEWKGSLFAGALAGMHLNRVGIKDGKPTTEDRLLKELGTRIRSVEQGPDGYIYVGTDDGDLWRLVPAK